MDDMGKIDIKEINENIMQSTWNYCQKIIVDTVEKLHAPEDFRHFTEQLAQWNSDHAANHHRVQWVEKHTEYQFIPSMNNPGGWYHERGIKYIGGFKSWADAVDDAMKVVGQADADELKHQLDLAKQTADQFHKDATPDPAGLHEPMMGEGE